MSLELYINDKLIELSDKSKIGLTYQVNDITNLDTRNSNFSNQFKVPKTRNNQIALEIANNINSNTVIPYRKNRAKIVQDGIEVIPDGFAVIQSTEDFYNIAVYSGNIDLFDFIGDRKVSELDWSGSDHDWIIGNVVATSNASLYIYPLIDWGKDFKALGENNSVWDNMLLPCAFIRDIFEKISDESGYEFSGSFITSTYYFNSILTPDNFKYSDEVVEEYSGFSETNAVQNYNHTGAVNQTFVHGWFAPIVSDAEFIDNTFNPVNNSIGQLIIKATAFIHAFADDASSYLKFQIVNVTDATLLASQTILQGPFDTSALYAIYVNTGNILFEGGKVYQARFELHLGITFIGNIFDLDLQTESRFEYKASDQIPFGGTIYFGNLFQIKQRDVIKDIVKQYDLIISTDSVKKKVYFNFYDDILQNIPSAIDWSLKIDLRSSPAILYKFSNFGQVNNFKYKEDSTVTTGYGDSEIIIDDETLNPEVDVVQLVTSATLKEIRLEGVECPKITALGLPELESPTTPVWNDVNNRILLLDRQTGSVNYYEVFPNNTGLVNVTDIPYCYFDKTGKNDNLKFDDLIQNHYKVIQSVLDKTKIIVGNFKLTAVDIQTLDFLIPIYLDVHTADAHINGYFYLNKIENWKQGELTKCTLIRI